jgi:hypothetical protein
MGTADDAGVVRRAWRATSRGFRAGVVAVVVGVILVGALLGPPARMLLWAPGVGLVTAGAALVAVPYATAGWTRRRTAVCSGLAGAALVPFTGGLEALGRAGGVVLMAILLLGALWLVDSVLEASPPNARQVARQDADRVRRGIEDLSVESLLVEWRAAAERLGPEVDPAVRVVAADLRADLLEELARRDPAGVRRWLLSGGADPGGYLAGV